MAFVETGGGGNNKYLSLKEGEFYVRLVGENIKFLTHFKLGDTRRICPKTASIRDPFTHAPLITNPDTGLEYPQEMIDSCPTCALGGENNKPRRRFAINAIDWVEKQNLDKQGLPVNVRIMEFGNSMFEWFVNFQQTYGFSPSDPNRAPVFKITVFFPAHKIKNMPDGTQKKEPKDIEYAVSFDPAHIDQFPLSESDKAAIYNQQKPGIYDLGREYNPFTQKKRSVFPQNTQAASLPSGSPSHIAGFQNPAGGPPPGNPGYQLQVPSGIPSGTPGFPATAGNVPGIPGAPVGFPGAGGVAPAPVNYDPNVVQTGAPQQFAPAPNQAAPAPAPFPAPAPAQAFPQQFPAPAPVPTQAFDPTQAPASVAPPFNPAQFAGAPAPAPVAAAPAPPFDPTQFTGQVPQQQFAQVPTATPNVAYQQPTSASNSEQLAALLATIGNPAQ